MTYSKINLTKVGGFQKMATPTATKIVNEALIHSGQEATFDYKLKNLLILIAEASIRQGYVDGWEDHEEAQPPKVTRKQLINFAELYKKARGESSHSSPT